MMASERVVFTEETNPQQYVKLVASGEVALPSAINATL
jgi:hypothetical protein